MLARTTLSLGTALLAAALLAPGCSAYRSSDGAAPRTLAQESEQALARMRAADASLSGFFDRAYAYAVFPSIAKGAAGIGAANGDGVAYLRTPGGFRAVGTAEVTQVTLGFQLGGQNLSQIVFFQDRTAFDTFARNQLEFAANASAVGVRQGAAASSDFEAGVAVFVQPREGLMLEAAIGGQRLSYQPYAGGGVTTLP
ncbi:MAG: hypothetical protein C0513_00305 [Isosphaera sp.]|nr:hypothetical protein [Isosphaera sp.]